MDFMISDIIASRCYPSGRENPKTPIYIGQIMQKLAKILGHKTPVETSQF